MVWHVPIVVLFSVLFAWIAANFFVAVFGFYMLVRGGDRFDISRSLRPETKVPRDAKTCITIPVYNEDPSHVFACFKAVYRSIERTGELEHFDFFILSDSSDPDVWVAEEAAWAAILAELSDSRIYYRHRRNRIQKKSGNIADFCRRWGSRYRYMIVLDADSIMTGELAVQLVKMMEVRPDVGIIQTVPKAANPHSLIARITQFAARAYGPLFTAGLHFWQLGDGGFWGHNAIVRMEPYMRFCALPKLGGSPPLGGEILSHDYVEAALLRRSGLGVWIAHDLDGSYEQLPPNLLVELDRDRRWCQGNLQHLRFIFMKGISSGYRTLFLIGNLFYFSSFLWLFFLFSVTFSLLAGRLQKPEYFPSRHMLFPQWPVYHFALSAVLLIATVTFLFGPKALSLAAIVIRRQTRGFGGFAKLAVSACLEIILSMLLAPIRMLFHSYYVFLTLLGRMIDWKAPPRSERRINIADALRAHGLGALVSVLWGTVLFYVDRTFFYWGLLFLLPLFFAVLSSMWTSRVDVGRAFQKKGFFVTPEELNPPRELVEFQAALKAMTLFSTSKDGLARRGFVHALFNPGIHALHYALLRPRLRPALLPGIVKDREALIQKALSKGTRGLTRKDKIQILTDAEALSRLHFSLRLTQPTDMADKWSEEKPESLPRVS